MRRKERKEKIFESLVEIYKLDEIIFRSIAKSDDDD